MTAIMNSSDSNSHQIMERPPFLITKQNYQIKDQSYKSTENHEPTKNEYKVHAAKFGATPITSLFQLTADPTFKAVKLKAESSLSVASLNTESSMAQADL